MREAEQRELKKEQKERRQECLRDGGDTGRREIGKIQVGEKKHLLFPGFD